MTGIVGIRTLLFHHRYVRPSSPTIITIGARHPLATEVQRSMSPRRNVARQHRHLVTTHHQITNSSRHSTIPGDVYIQVVIIWNSSIQRHLYCGLLQQQEDYSRKPRKEEERSQRRKPEERRQKTQTWLLR